MIISKKHSRHTVLLTVLSCILLITACNQNNGDINTPKPQKKLHRVETVSVEQRAVTLSQTISGTLEAVTRIRLYNEESGRITELPFHEGDRVKKGQLLIQLDNALLKTDVAKAKASREQAEVDLSRLTKLLPKKISTEEEVARAQTELDLADAQLEHEITRLQRTSIRAPIDGLITERLYEPGDMLAPNSHILSIIDPTALLLKAELSERLLPMVKQNHPVSLSIDALGEQSYDARVIRIHPTINTSTYKGTLEILLKPVPEGASVGQFSRASFELTTQKHLILPVHTIHYDPQGAYVYRIIKDADKNDIAEKLYFQQGKQLASYAEVLSELKPGDQVVSRGFLGLRDGKKVLIADTDDSTDKVATTTNNVAQ